MCVYIFLLNTQQNDSLAFRNEVFQSSKQSKLQEFHLENWARLERIFDEHMCFEWLTQVPPSKKTNIFWVSDRSNTRIFTLTDGRDLICCFFGRFQTVEMKDGPS